MSNYSYLSKPITFRKMTVKNRIFLPPMKTNYISHDHSMSDEIIQYYEDMAKGGIGLITTEAAEVDGEHLYDDTILGVFDDSQIPGLQKLAKTLHKYGTKLSVQLIQGGPFAFSKDNEGRMPLSSSPIAHLWNPMETPKEMTKEDIKYYIKKYAEAALRAKKADCDAVEIHCAHGHALLGSFLSPLVNHRTDEYGGDLKSRARFLVEVVQGIREAVGEDFPVSVRLSADECEEGGNTALDTAYVIRLLEKVGIDYVNLSNGTLFDLGRLLPPTGKPLAVNTVYSDVIKNAVHTPIGGVGRIKEPWVADMLIEQNRLDFVYIGRPMIADPSFAGKILEDKLEEVRPCIGCLTCLATSALGITMQCTMNPAIADYKLKQIIPADIKKKIAVIGGGPAGLEAAAIAAKRGHTVTLYEKESVLGGQFRFASHPPVKQELANGVKYLINEAKKAGVEIKLNFAITEDNIKKLDADEVVLSTGSFPSMPKWILSSNHPNIISAWDVLRGRKHAGANVVVIGGGSVGCETAEFIADRHSYFSQTGKKVSIIEMAEFLDPADYTANRDYLMARLENKPIDVITSAAVTKLGEDSVTYKKNDKDVTIENVDTIVVAMGSRPENSLAELIEKNGYNLHVIGDAEKTGKIINAIAAGRKLALTL